MSQTILHALCAGLFITALIISGVVIRNSIRDAIEDEEEWKDY
jgi:hypothetical protein